MTSRYSSRDRKVVTSVLLICILSMVSSFSFSTFLSRPSRSRGSGIVVKPPPSATSSSLLQATVEDTTDTTSSSDSPTTEDAPSCDLPIFSNVMAANRAEIAVRIMRAATELNAGTVAIYAHEDRYSQHRWGADRSFLLEKESDATPISAYLDIPQIIQVAKDAHVGKCLIR